MLLHTLGIAVLGGLASGAIIHGFLPEDDDVPLSASASQRIVWLLASEQCVSVSLGAQKQFEDSHVWEVQPDYALIGRESVPPEETFKTVFSAAALSVNDSEDRKASPPPPSVVTRLPSITTVTGGPKLFSPGKQHMRVAPAPRNNNPIW